MPGLKWLPAVILIWCSLVSVYKPFILYVCCLIVDVLHLIFRYFAEYWHCISHKHKPLKRWCEIHIICDFRVTDESFKRDSRKKLIQDTAQVYKISLTSKVHFKRDFHIENMRWYLLKHTYTLHFIVISSWSAH